MGALHKARPSCPAGEGRSSTLLLPCSLTVCWMPCRIPEKLRRCAACAQGKIKSLEQIYLFSLPVKEFQIVEAFLGTALKDEVMKIMPVQKQTRAGQRTRFKVLLALAEGNSLQHPGAAASSACQGNYSLTGVGSKRQVTGACQGRWVRDCLRENAGRQAAPSKGVAHVACAPRGQQCARAGVCGGGRQQRARGPGREVREGGGHRHPRRHHPGQDVHRARAPRLLG